VLAGSSSNRGKLTLSEVSERLLIPGPFLIVYVAL